MGILRKREVSIRTLNVARIWSAEIPSPSSFPLVKSVELIRWFDRIDARSRRFVVNDNSYRGTFLSRLILPATSHSPNFPLTTVLVRKSSGLPMNRIFTDAGPPRSEERRVGKE